MQKISEMIDGDQKEIKLVAQTVNSTLLQFYGYSTIKDICKPAAEEPEDKRSLQELLEELNALVGLKQVKEKVHDLIVYQQVQKMRREKNLHSAKTHYILLSLEIRELERQRLLELLAESTRKSGCFPRGIL